MWKLGISLLSFRVLCLHKELYSISSLEKQYIGLSLFLFFNIAQLTEHLTGKKLTGARILTIGIGMGWDGRLVKHWSTSVFISGSVQRIERKLSAVFFSKVYVPFHLRQDTAEDTFRDTTLMRPAVSVRSSSTVVAEEMKIILKLWKNANKLVSFLDLKKDRSRYVFISKSSWFRYWRDTKLLCEKCTIDTLIS